MKELLTVFGVIGGLVAFGIYILPVLLVLVISAISGFVELIYTDRNYRDMEVKDDDLH